MTSRLWLYDDPADLPHFLPFIQSRPIGELAYGAYLLRERAAHALGLEAAGHLAPAHLSGYAEPGAPPVVATPDPEHGALLVRSTFVAAAQDAVAAAEGSSPARLIDADGTTVGAWLPAGAPWPGSADAGWRTVPLQGRRLAGVWTLVADLVPALQADLAAVRANRLPDRVPAGSTVLGDPTALMVDAGAIVEPHVVFDVRNGPIWVQGDAEIRAFTRLAGPLVIGEGSRMVGGQVRESRIGPRCVVHGEVSNTSFLGYANKGHDGFLGHSIVGRWVNLGAGTVTSNLKNTYGPVRLNLGAARVETGLTFLGSLFGDHVKTAIGTMLPTGCVVGTGANLFGTLRPAAAVRPFAWGTDADDRVVACRMFLQTAGRVLPRRDIPFDDATRAWLTAVWEAATATPCS